MARAEGSPPTSAATVTISGGSRVNGNTGAGLGGGIVNFAEAYGVSVTDGSHVDNNVLTNVETASVTSGLLMIVNHPNLDRAFLSSGRGDANLMRASGSSPQPSASCRGPSRQPMRTFRATETWRSVVASARS